METFWVFVVAPIAAAPAGSPMLLFDLYVSEVG